MSQAHLLALPAARRIRLAHNEHKHFGTSIRTFIRNHGVAPAFPCRGELRRALDKNELWTLQLDGRDSSSGVFVAAAAFPLLIERADAEAVRGDDPAYAAIAPPLPRHDCGLVLEAFSDDEGAETWNIVWSEYPGFTCSLRSRSLRALLVRALEKSAQSAQATVDTFRQYTMMH